MNKPTFLSLFAGIGGIDLGLERAGFRCVGQVEIDPFCRRVLAKHWPDVPRFEDVRTFTKDNISEPIDLIAGGFPCQDVSDTGRKAGIEGARSGLWHEFQRIIRDVRPRFAFVENVTGLLKRGMGTVLSDLADMGLDAEWGVLPAASVGAPQIRERVCVLAYSTGERRSAGPVLSRDVVKDLERGQDAQAWGPGHLALCRSGRIRLCPDASILGVADGLPARVDRLRGLGNAVVPQVAEWIGRRIKEAMEGVTP